ncbi:hypothetical protein NMY22_g9298 [Coprinellus aureogranulatus]|nr:hypothetical protein NMY22_g9298 [Coprinellus aureogranulatus]
MQDDSAKKTEMKLVVPELLKQKLVDDWEWVTKDQRIVPLPREPNVVKILEKFKKHILETKPPHLRDPDLLIDTFNSGIECYFDKSLGSNLLYRFERKQYSDVRKRYYTGGHVKLGVDDLTEMSDIYGAEHLLRMIVSLPGMVAQSNLDPDSVVIVRDYVNELLQYMLNERDELFVKEYEQPGTSYQNLIRCLNRTSADSDGRFFAPATTQLYATLLMHIVVDIAGEAELHLHSDTPDDLVHIPETEDDHMRSQYARTLRGARTTAETVGKVSSLFISAWKHPRPFPNIKNIFYVAHSSADALAHLSRFSNYSNKVGNTQLLFHGTTRTCTLGSSDTQTRLCSRPDCNLCLILRGSYDIEKAKSGVEDVWNGDLLNECILKFFPEADLYASWRIQGRLKSVILNHVVLGRTQLMKSADQSLQHAPDIYNSVTGATTSEGGALAYHEAVVYREDAMCASAVIFYE